MGGAQPAALINSSKEMAEVPDSEAILARDDDQPIGEGSEEIRGYKALRQPQGPTREEWLRHMVSHMPYRAWCPHCVAGRGKASAHFSKLHEPQRIISCDYCFMGKGGEEEVKRSPERRLAPARVEEEAPVVVAGDDEERGCVAVLVHKNHLDRWVDSDVVPSKGADPWATKCGTDALEDSGLTNFVYKSDGENAIKTMKREVAREFRKSRAGCNYKV